MLQIHTLSCLFISLFLLNFSAIAQNIETVVQTGHYSEVTTVAFSPDGKFIATGSRDKTIKLWRSSDGKEIRSYLGSSSGISNVSFNKQCSMLLSVNFSGEADIWDIKTGNILKKLKINNDKITCAAFHPSGNEVVLGSENSYIYVWNIQTGEKIKEIKAIPQDLPTDKQFPSTFSIGHDFPLVME